MHRQNKLLSFSATQNKIITSTVTFVCLVVLVMGVVLFITGLLSGLNYFFNIVGPVIVAFFLSLLTRPWYARLNTWFKGKTALSVLAFSLSFLIPIFLLCWYFGAFLLQQSNNLIQILPKIITETQRVITEKLPGFADFTTHLIPNIKAFLATDGSLSLAKLLEATNKGVYVGGAVFSAGSAALLWLLTFFYWIIFVTKDPMSGEDLAKRLPFLSDNGRIAMARYFQNFNDIIVSYFRGQIIDVTIQGLLYGTAFQCLGLPNGFIIGFVLGLLNLVPYLGVTVGLCMALPVAFFHGGLFYTCCIFFVFCVIQTFDGYVMQPYIQGNRMKLSAWQIVFALLFWTQLGGFLGLLLAIPLTAFVKASWNEWRTSAERFIFTSEKAPPFSTETHE